MKIKLIVGLGNPDKTYENTYHNAGILMLEYLAKKIEKSGRHDLPPAQKNGYAEYFKLKNLVLARSLSYMNESGKVAAGLLRFFKMQPEQALIMHDDSDLAIGKYKLSFGRGTAGHHGAESVAKAIGSKDFWRLRIGIRDVESDEKLGRKKAAEFVLKKISAAHKKALYCVFEEACGEIEKLIEKDVF